MKRIGLVIFPGFQVVDMAAATVFEMANREVPNPAYGIDVVSESGGAVKCSLGPGIQTIALDPHAYDTLLVAGEIGAPTPATKRNSRRPETVRRRAPRASGQHSPCTLVNTVPSADPSRQSFPGTCRKPE